MITDSSGIVFSCSKKKWLFRGLIPLSEPKRRQIIETMQYLDQPLEYLENFVQQAGDDTRIIRIKEDQGQIPFLTRSAPLANSNWDAHVLLPIPPIVYDTLMTSSLVTLGWLSVYFILITILNRRDRLHQQLQARAQTEIVLKEAHDKLELRVEKRTSALQKSNQQLQEEIRKHEKTHSELSQAQGDLVQAAKLAVLGQMAAGITHELNQPLTAICHYTDNARTLLAHQRPAETDENLKHIARLGEHMGNIIGQLKSYTRKSPSDMRPFSVQSSINEALTLLAIRIKKHKVQVETLIDEDLIVLGDRVRLEQVMLNLIINACDAMQEQQTKKIRIEASKKDGHMAFITVRDFGPGISPELQARVFDPFFTTKGSKVNMGLGLSISFSIVKEFGGNLSLSNHAQGGAQFTIELRTA